MQIAIVGLGYVGTVGAACLSELGHTVVGLDIDETKVARLNDGQSSIIERGLDSLLARHVAAGGIRAATALAEEAADTDIVFVTVGTPSLPSGEPDLRPLHAVCRDLNAALARRTRSQPLHIVIRSTVPPGTLRGVVIPYVAGDRFVHGRDFFVGANPEFLREGSAISDFMHASFCLLGADHRECFDRMREVYAPLPLEIVETDLDSAELVKYASNAFHALKVCFGNELGTLARALGLDGREVMDIFCRDRVLNISSKYLSPGFSYGGSCLPKDVRALNSLARTLRADLPLLASIPRSNDAHTRRGLEIIHELGRKKVSLFGLAFKRGTADLRSSPLLFMLDHLQAREYDVRVHDEDVAQAIERGLYEPQIAERLAPLVVGLDEAIAHAEVAVIGKTSECYDDLHARRAADVPIIDLAGQNPVLADIENYIGICWANPSPAGDRIARELNASIREQTAEAALEAVDDE